ncbi:unnamed protein product [Cochlearia groenlandica]
MSFSMVLFHNPYLTTTPTLPIKIFTISSASFKPRRSSSSSSSNRIFPIKNPKPLNPKLQIETLSARDIPIDFGKHKGKMLGSLPSSYLKWVSKNLRAGDSEYWAKLADQVLEDDVYKDRIEWEFAENILHGSDDKALNITKQSKNIGEREEISSVSMLLEISERFGWDNEDKIAWSRINFELLGTSKSCRIPRLMKRGEMVSRRREFKREEKEEDENGCRRRERRERMRKSLGKEDDDGKSVNSSQEKGILGKLGRIEKRIEIENKKIHNSPFPGRESLLKKVMNKKSVH